MEFFLSLLFFGIFTLLLIYLSGWFSSTETALTNLSLVDMAAIKDDKRYKYLELLRGELDKSVVSILIMNNLVNVLLSVIPVLFLSLLFGEMFIGILIIAITLIIILFGDIAPKSRAIHNKKQVVLKNARIMYYIFLITQPLVKLLLYLSRIINKIFGYGNKETQVIDDQIIKEIVTRSEESGVIKSIEKELITNVFDFGDSKVKEIYLKKEKVFFLIDDILLKDARKIIAKKPFTRIPFLENNKVKGVLYSKDVLSDKRMKISKVLKKPFFVKPEDDISDIFKKMKRKRVHLGIVVNKKKEFLGIITLEDIIEEVLGSIHDEFHSRKETFRKEV